MHMTNQIVVAFMLGEGIILGIIAYEEERETGPLPSNLG